MSIRLASLAVLLTAAAGPALAQDPTPARSPSVPAYVDETVPSGLSHTFAGEWEFMVGGGAAAFDCSGDGFPELVLAGGTNKARLFHNTSTQGGALRFEPQESGLEFDQVSGAYPADVDGDGITDVILLRVGENVAMRGLGTCRFERANEAWGFAGGDSWWTSLAATWEEGADWPTVAVGSYIDREEEISPWGSCTDNWLLRPVPGARRFGAPVALEPGFCPLSMMFTDWNRSGTPSLRVSNDREYYEGGQEQLWRVEPGSEPALYTADEGWKSLRIWGMGIAGHDLNDDGYPEYFLTSMADSKLQTLANASGGGLQPSYADIAFKLGVTAHRPYVGDDTKPSTGWHTEFQDVNNDGRADIFVVKGNVWEMPDFAMLDPNNLLLQKEDGTFEEAGDRAGVASVRQGRGGAVVDLNLDGLLDIVAVNRNDLAEVWRNTGGDGIGRWLQVRLAQDGPNRDAIGAWIEVRCGGRVMRHEVTIGGGHAGGQLGWRHFGVGDHAEAELRVIWPDGSQSDWQTVPSDGFYVVAKGRPAERWQAVR